MGPSCGASLVMVDIDDKYRYSILNLSTSTTAAPHTTRKAMPHRITDTGMTTHRLCSVVGVCDFRAVIVASDKSCGPECRTFSCHLESTSAHVRPDEVLITRIKFIVPDIIIIISLYRCARSESLHAFSSLCT